MPQPLLPRALAPARRRLVPPLLMLSWIMLILSWIMMVSAPALLTTSSRPTETFRMIKELVTLILQAPLHERMPLRRPAAILLMPRWAFMLMTIKAV